MKTLVCISIGWEPYFRPRSEDRLCLRDTVVRVQLRHGWLKLSGPYRVPRHLLPPWRIRAFASKPEDTSARFNLSNDSHRPADSVAGHGRPCRAFPNLH
jgi:hypothetical protein